MITLIPDFGGEIGLGHVSRIAALTMALLDLDQEVRIDCNEKIFSEFLEDSYRKKVSYGKCENGDFVVVDSYRIEKFPKNVLRANLAAFEDHKIDFIGEKAGLILRNFCLRVKYFGDQNVKVKNEAVVFLKSYYDETKCKNFLDKFTPIASKFVQKINVVGLDFVSPKDVYKLMRESKFAFGAAGQTAMELAAIGCPQFIFEQVENQKNNVEYLKKLENVILLEGDSKTIVNFTNLEDKIVELLDKDRAQDVNLLNGAEEAAKLIIKSL